MTLWLTSCGGGDQQEPSSKAGEPTTTQSAPPGPTTPLSKNNDAPEPPALTAQATNALVNEAAVTETSALPALKERNYVGPLADAYSTLAKRLIDGGMG